MKCEEHTDTSAPGDIPHIGKIYREDISDQSRLLEWEKTFFLNVRNFTAILGTSERTSCYSAVNLYTVTATPPHLVG